MKILIEWNQASKENHFVAEWKSAEPLNPFLFEGKINHLLEILACFELKFALLITFNENFHIHVKYIYFLF